jgi:hypothetical protein
VTEQQRARATADGLRAGSRRGVRRPRGRRGAVLGSALGITLAVIAWGYLVWAAIDFGSAARDGDRGAWGFLALASIGAVACLFVALMLVARLIQALGASRADGSTTSGSAGGAPTATRRPAGGKRAAR